MTNESDLPAYNFDAVVLPEQSRGSLPAGATRVSLHTADGVYPAVTWLPPSSLRQSDGCVVTGRAFACEIATESDQRQFVLTRIDRHFQGNALAHVATTACPLDGEVNAVRMLVSQVQSAPIPAFIEEAFSDPQVFLWFWTCPASLAHHHAQAGGLARHSLHVAERAGLAVGDQPMQRDFAIAYGLLHDYGKVWAYDEGRLTPMAQRLGHEQIGYEKLLPALLRLRDACPDGGLVMQSLLSGQWKRDGKAPIQAVGNVVRSLDQFSAESDITRRREKFQKWRPVLVK